MPKIDVITRLRLHVEYSIKRDEWAQRAIDLLAKGEDADEAIEQAEYWELKAKSLEP